MASLTNQIIANIKKTADNINASSYINSENVVCIDSSENRIGINTKFPKYAIHISGDTINDSVYTRDIYVRNLVDSIDISSINIYSTEISCNILKINSGLFNEISGLIINVDKVITNDISLSKFFCEDISTLNIDISDNINTYNLNVQNTLTTDTIFANNFNFSQINLDGLIVINDALIGGKIVVNGISSETISSDIINVNTLNVNNVANFLEEANFQNMNVNSDASFVSLFSETSIVTTLSSENIYFNTISGNTINITNITSNNRNIISNGIFGDINNPTTAIFSDISVTNIDVSNIKITDVLVNTGISDLSNGELILPKYKENITTPISGSIALDILQNVLKIYNNNEWNNFNFLTNYGTFKLNNSIPGNSILYNSFNNSYSIDNSENLFLNINISAPYNNYKYIPLELLSSTNKFNIINNGKILSINDICHNQIFEITSTLVLRYLNKIPGDVEPNTYKFGLYPNILSAQPIIDSIDNSFIEVYNSIIAFDNSYNYSQSVINYIGPLGSSTNIALRNGFSFYLNSEKDLKYLQIHSFNVTIKQIL